MDSARHAHVLGMDYYCVERRNAMEKGTGHPGKGAAHQSLVLFFPCLLATAFAR